MSTQSGVGKSLHIRKMKDKLVKTLKQNQKSVSQTMITVPLHGPVVTTNEILSMLLQERTDSKSCIIHLDIPERVRFLLTLAFTIDNYNIGSKKYRWYSI